MTPLVSVVAREFRRLPRFPVLWALLGPIPLAAGVLLTGVFRAEVARRLPIGVVDLDGSDAVRRATRGVGEARTVNIVARMPDLGEAQDALQAAEGRAVASERERRPSGRPGRAGNGCRQS